MALVTLVAIKDEGRVVRHVMFKMAAGQIPNREIRIISQRVKVDIATAHIGGMHATGQPASQTDDAAILQHLIYPIYVEWMEGEGLNSLADNRNGRAGGGHDAASNDNALKETGNEAAGFIGRLGCEDAQGGGNHDQQRAK